jgi:hypothetical protein
MLIEFPREWKERCNWAVLYLVVRVPGYRPRGQIFCEVVGLERGPFSLVSTIEELTE